MNGKYKFTWNQPKLSKLRSNIHEGIAAAGFSTANKAAENAPVGVYPPGSNRTGGALANSIHFTMASKWEGLVIAGGNWKGKSIAYARKREYENRKNPQTKRYMGRAFDDLKANYAKYFKGVTK